MGWLHRLPPGLAAEATRTPRRRRTAWRAPARRVNTVASPSARPSPAPALGRGTHAVARRARRGHRASAGTPTRPPAAAHAGPRGSTRSSSTCGRGRSTGTPPPGSHIERRGRRGSCRRSPAPAPQGWTGRAKASDSPFRDIVVDRHDDPGGPELQTPGLHPIEAQHHSYGALLASARKRRVTSATRSPRKDPTSAETERRRRWLSSAAVAPLTAAARPRRDRR